MLILYDEKYGWFGDEELKNADENKYINHKKYLEMKLEFINKSKEIRKELLEEESKDFNLEQNK